MATITPSNYIIAIVIVLVFLLVGIIIWAIQGLTTWNTSKKIRYPPWVSPCPDYWVSVGNGKCKQLSQMPNTNKDGANGPLSSNNNSGTSATERNGLSLCTGSNHVTTSPYTAQAISTANEIHEDTPTNFSNMSMQQKCKWASKCGVYWEGISVTDCNRLNDTDTTTTT